MTRLQRFFLAITTSFVCIATFPASAADMTFQFINDTDRPLSLKLFSRGESLQQWPSKSKVYTVRPDAAVQQLKIICTEEEPICWGAWMAVENVSGEIGADGKRATRTTKYVAGVGDRGVRPCTTCCHVCKPGTLTPVAKLNDPGYQAR